MLRQMWMLQIWKIMAPSLLNISFPWCLPGRSVQAEAEAGETEEGGGVLGR